jgi:hypothetical protein
MRIYIYWQVSLLLQKVHLTAIKKSHQHQNFSTIEPKCTLWDWILWNHGNRKLCWMSFMPCCGAGYWNNKTRAKRVWLPTSSNNRTGSSQYKAILPIFHVRPVPHYSTNIKLYLVWNLLQKISSQYILIFSEMHLSSFLIFSN